MADLPELDTNSKAVLISAEREQAVLRLTLSNPPANVLSVDLMEALGTALAAARSRMLDVGRLGRRGCDSGQIDCQRRGSAVDK